MGPWYLKLWKYTFESNIKQNCWWNLHPYFSTWPWAVSAGSHDKSIVWLYSYIRGSGRNYKPHQHIQLRRRFISMCLLGRLQGLNSDQESTWTRNNGSPWSRVSSWWRSWAVPGPSAAAPRLGLPPQSHHSDGDRVLDVCHRRAPLSAAVGGCDGGVHLCGLSLRLHGADAGADGPGVDPRPEREAEKETAVRVGMTFRK